VTLNWWRQQLWPPDKYQFRSLEARWRKTKMMRSSTFVAKPQRPRRWWHESHSQTPKPKHTTGCSLTSGEHGRTSLNWKWDDKITRGNHGTKHSGRRQHTASSHKHMKTGQNHHVSSQTSTVNMYYIRPQSRESEGEVLGQGKGWMSGWGRGKGEGPLHAFSLTWLWD